MTWWPRATGPVSPAGTPSTPRPMSAVACGGCQSRCGRPWAREGGTLSAGAKRLDAPRRVSDIIMADERRVIEVPERGEKVDLSKAVPHLAERQIVRGTVVRVDTEGVLVDVGAKSEGLIPTKEMSKPGAADEVSVGDRIDVMVLRTEGEEGSIILSKRRADVEMAWRRIQDALQSGKVLHAMVVDKVKGGLVVDLGLRGFVPGSHVDLTQARGRRFEWFVGQSTPLRVLEVDRGKGGHEAA